MSSLTVVLPIFHLHSPLYISIDPTTIRALKAFKSFLMTTFVYLRFASFFSWMYSRGLDEITCKHEEFSGLFCSLFSGCIVRSKFEREWNLSVKYESYSTQKRAKKHPFDCEHRGCNFSAGLFLHFSSWWMLNFLWSEFGVEKSKKASYGRDLKVFEFKLCLLRRVHELEAFPQKDFIQMNKPGKDWAEEGQIHQFTR